VKVFKDALGLLLLAVLLPVWIALGLGVVAVVVGRQLYWWARGNTSVVSRLSARVMSSSRYRASTASTHDPVGPATVAGLADAPAGGGLNPAVSAVSGR
jgi:hypothetical protein